MFPRLIASLMLLGFGISAPAPGADDEDPCAATAAFLDGPFGVAADSAGNLYIADPSARRIRRVDAVTQRMTTVAGTGIFGFSGDDGPASEARLRSPHGVATDSAGNLYIADPSAHRIRRVDALTKTITTIAGGGVICLDNTTVCWDQGDAVGAVLNSPTGVALDDAGAVYIADTAAHRIRKVVDGVIDTIAGSGPVQTGTGGFEGDGAAATAARLNNPVGVAVDGQGAVYIADRDNHRIRKVAPDGTIETIAGDGTPGFDGDGAAATAARLNNPVGVAVDRRGAVYIADQDNHRIRKVSSNGTIETIAGDGMPGFDGDGAAATAARLNNPVGVAVDGQGVVYIADNGNRRIRRIAADETIDTIAGRGERGSGDQAGGAISPVCTSPPQISFALPQDADPASQTVTLYRARGDTEFLVRPSHNWVSVEPRSGSLAEDEEATVRVTVNPVGLRLGTHYGRLFIHSGEGAATVLTVVLEVLSPLGPAISEHGVVNAAGLSAFGEPVTPFGASLLPLVPGSLVAVLGENFTAGGLFEAPSGEPLPLSLGGVTVTVDDLQASLFEVGPSRIDIQLPLQLTTRLSAEGPFFPKVVVRTAGTSSYPRTVFVGPYAPGVFTVSGAGAGQGAIVFSGGADLAAPRGFSGNSRPARAGDVVEIYATGLGAVEPPIGDGVNSCEPQGRCLADFSNVVLRRTAELPRVTIGGVAVAPEKVLFSGLAPSFVAVNVVIVEAPRSIAPDEAAPVTIAIGGRKSSSKVTMAIE